MLKTEAVTNTGTPARDRLKQEIERCKKSYRGKTFIVNRDERLEPSTPMKSTASSPFSKRKRGSLSST